MEVAREFTADMARALSLARNLRELYRVFPPYRNV